jgi:hypothetical protein
MPETPAQSVRRGATGLRLAESSAHGELGLTAPMCQEADRSHPWEPTRQAVAPETAEPFHGCQRHRAEPVAALRVLPPADHLTVVQGHAPPVRESDARAVAREILEDGLGLAQGVLRRDDPCGTPPSPPAARPGLRGCELLTAAAQRARAPAGDVCERREAQASAAPAEALHWPEEVRPTGEPAGPVGSQAPRGEDTGERRGMVELLAPGMEHRQAAEVRPEMLRGPGAILERLGHGPAE